MTTITIPGRYHGLPSDEYHRHPALGHTGMLRLLKAPRLLWTPWDGTSSTQLGTLVHAFTLGTDPADEHLALAEHDGRTKAGKDERAKAAEDGVTLVAGSVWHTAERMAAQLLAHPTVGPLLAPGNGDREVSLFGRDDYTGIPVKARPDWWDGDLVIDIKTTTDASPAGFARAVARYGYHVQAAHYLTMTGARQFLFAAVESTPPYLAAVYELDDPAITEGSALAAEALNLYARLAERPPEEWPGYPTETVRLSLPPWATAHTPTPDNNDDDEEY